MADILLGNVKGPQGNIGATGSQGPQGDAATITVGTVSTTVYGNPASVTNSGTEQDAVLDFVIPQGKPGEQTTRMGALTLDTITAQSADFPIPAVGETGSTVFGKIIKFFNSTISALNSKLNISDVVNNLTSTSTTQPLSAAQGKALNDALATTNNAKADKTTVNEIGSRFIVSIYPSSSSGVAIKEQLRILLANIHNQNMADFTTKRTYPIYLEMTGQTANTFVGYCGISPTAMRFFVSSGASTDIYHGIFILQSHQIQYFYKITSSVAQ